MLRLPFYSGNSSNHISIILLLAILSLVSQTLAVFKDGTYTITLPLLKNIYLTADDGNVKLSFSPSYWKVESCGNDSFHIKPLYYDRYLVLLDDQGKVGVTPQPQEWYIPGTKFTDGPYYVGIRDPPGVLTREVGNIKLVPRLDGLGAEQLWHFGFIE
ncbi:hypothetical protein INT43_007680 [Umbelopsis isabellina]|uniref:Uncharacterized protein n=1 Tax=Mortierella isabellina TaxID=91625 RepID=A0A8H7PN73_MORIS|nr:hypothetical protein INT43_007680 [Umbelopsis isabellina]